MFIGKPFRLGRRSSDLLSAVASAHAEHRRRCDALLAFSTDPDRWSDTRAAAALHAFLAHDLPAHAAEEDQVLFPALLEQGLDPADDVGVDLAMAASHHERHRILLARLLPEVSRLAAGRAPTSAAGFVAGAAAFVHGYRRHMEMEESAFLARASLCEAPGNRHA